MQYNAHNFINAVQKYREIGITSARDLRDMYGPDPVPFLSVFDVSTRFPAKIKQVFDCLYFEKDLQGNPKRRFIVAGPRGGGKSKLLGAVGFSKWFFQYRDIVDMGGSLEQAKGVYNYFRDHCYSTPVILDDMPKEPMIQRSVTNDGNYFKAVAASMRQVRGPHPDVLFIDEACETKDELIEAAMPMIDTSEHSMLVMTSTFHKSFGIFQEVYDNAEELGYCRITWDVFDVCTPFNPDIWDDERLNREIPDLHKLKERSKGRIGDPFGWISIDNIIQAWREKRSIDWFDVEYMGSRPSAEGLVNDPLDVEKAIFEEAKHPERAYETGAEVVAGLDWGFSSMTAFGGFMRYTNEQKVQVASRSWSRVDLDLIIEDIVEDVIKFQITHIYADSAGKFENRQLQTELDKALSAKHWRCRVIEVVFSKDKDEMLGNYRAHFQQNKLLIPARFKEPISQHKNYRYQDGSDKPMKKDDHHPDMTMCALKHWPLGKVVQELHRPRADRRTSTITGGLKSKSF